MSLRAVTQNISVLNLVRNPQSRLKISESVGKDKKKIKINFIDQSKSRTLILFCRALRLKV